MTVPNKLCVLIADDHAPTRAGVHRALEQSGISVCGAVKTAHEAVEQARLQRPDAALLDIHMPGSGIWAAEVISRELPDTAVVMLTASADEQDLFNALRAGARGYLLKDIAPERLGPALISVLEGEAALPRALAARVLEEFRRTGTRARVPLLGKRRVELSDREYETLDLLRQGLSTGQIAERLFVTPATVRSHISSVLRKLRVTSRREAVAVLEQHREQSR